MKILLIGDVFGKPGRRVIRETLPSLIQDESIDFVIANGENMAGGKGMTESTCQELYDSGVDIITSGNHTRDKKEIDPFLESDERLLRPINWTPPFPGRGQVVARTKQGRSVGVVNSMGKVHIKGVECPFAMTKKAVEEVRNETPIVIVDFHAEATSEARMMGWHLNGLASAVLGTHTHVPTADEEVLSKGTAYITDVGMTGPYESVIGLSIELAEGRFFRGDRKKFGVGKNDIRLCAALVDVDDRSGKARSIKRVRRDLKN